MTFYLLILFLISFKTLATETDTFRIYVAPDGNDKNPGTQISPLKSIEKARDIIRVKRKELKEQPVVVYIGEGYYNIKSPVIFTSEDSGTEEAPVLYTSGTGKKPVFTGSIGLKKWKVLKDKRKLNLLDPSVSGKIYVTDLKSSGITDYGDPTEPGSRPELYCNSSLQKLARWPDEGFTKAGVSRGKTELHATYTGERGTMEGIFEYKDIRINRWEGENDIRTGGYWYWDWSEEYHKVERIDTLTQTVFIQGPYHRYGYKDSLRYYGLNLFCEMDKPGEWYLDRQTGLLYWYPPEKIKPAEAEVRLTMFSAPYMIELRNCSNITIKGLALQESRGSAVLINDGNNCKISDCRIERFGRDGIHSYL